ncbi:Zinc-binding domain containing protein [Naviculisporaceae sp. PSN 640]
MELRKVQFSAGESVCKRMRYKTMHSAVNGWYFQRETGCVAFTVGNVQLLLSQLGWLTTSHGCTNKTRQGDLHKGKDGTVQLLIRFVRVHVRKKESMSTGRRLIYRCQPRRNPSNMCILPFSFSPLTLSHARRMSSGFYLEVQISTSQVVPSQDSPVTKKSSKGTQKQRKAMPTPTDKGAPNAQPKKKSKSSKSKSQTQTKNTNQNSQTPHSRPGKEKHTKPTIILPHLHKKIIISLQGAISPDPVYIHPGSKELVVAETHRTNVVGSFSCVNPSCGTGAWSSGLVATVIRRFVLPTGMRYNATVYNQRCKTCHQLGAMNVDKEVYVERVAYRLKVWAGIPVERPFYEIKETPPHMEDLCEGCKRGVCRAGDKTANYRQFSSRRGNRMY